MTFSQMIKKTTLKEIPSFHELLWKDAGVIVLRNHGFISADEYDIHFVHIGDKMKAVVNFSDEKEQFLYELKGGSDWFVKESKTVYMHMRDYMQKRGI